MRDAEERLQFIKREGKLVRGRAEIIKFLEGKPLTARQTVLARCYDCMGYFVDGRQDCDCPMCPSYPFMAYSTKPRVKHKKPAGVGFKSRV